MYLAMPYGKELTDKDKGLAIFASLF